MGHMKRVWGTLTEREQWALAKLHEIARTTGTDWLRCLALKKARELEQLAFDRDRGRLDLDLAREMRNPYESGFGRHPA